VLRRLADFFTDSQITQILLSLLNVNPAIMGESPTTHEASSRPILGNSNPWQGAPKRSDGGLVSAEADPA
jgi:hypothetical protein